MKFNKGYLFFILVVLFGLAFNIIQMNGIKMSADVLLLTNDLEKTPTEKEINEPLSMSTTLTTRASPVNNNPKEFPEEPLKALTVDSEQEVKAYDIEDEYGYLISEHVVSELSAEEQLRLDFRKELNRSKKRNKFLIDSVFERQPDELWSSGAEILLTQLMTELAVEYGFEADLGKVQCSDVMCFVSLKKVHKLPHMVYNFKIMRDGDFGSFNFFNGGKSRKGIYIHRFKTIY